MKTTKKYLYLSLLTLLIFSIASPIYAQKKSRKKASKSRIQRLNRRHNELEEYEISTSDIVETPYHIDNMVTFQNAGPDSISFINTAMLRYEVSPRLDIRLVNENELQKNTHSDAKSGGFAPLTLGSRGIILESNKLAPEIGIEIYFTLPFLATKSLRTASVAPTTFLTFEHTLNDKWSVSYSGGAGLDGESKVPFYNLTANTTYNPFKKWNFFADYYNVVQSKYLPYHTGDIGFTYDISNTFEVNFLVGSSLNRSFSEAYLSAGFSWALARRKRK